MRLELYSPSPSPIHRLHPATKLALLGATLVAPFLTASLLGQAIAIGFLAAAAALGRVLRDLVGPWRLMLFIFDSTAVLWAFFGAPEAPGVPYFERLMWAVEPAVVYGLRLTAVFLFGLLFLTTTRIEEVVHALQAFRVPYRVAFALGLAFRLVPLFLRSAGAIVEAQRARGLDLESGSLIERLRRYGPVLVPIFMTSLRGADQMAMALEARGFGANCPRTSYRHYPFGKADLLALALGAWFVAVLAALPAAALSSVPVP